MKNRIYILLTIFAFTFSISFSQEEGKTITGVDKEYNNLKYKEVIRDLNKAVKSGDNSPEVMAKLANAYYFNVEMEEAAKWYGELLAQNTAVDFEYYYRYAMALKATGKYEDANKYLKRFAVLKPNDSRSIKFMESPDYLTTIDKLSGNFTIENLDINSRFSDFGTSFYNDGIVFASSRGEGKLYKWNEQPFLDLFYVKTGDDKPKRLGEKINTKFHESSTSFTSDGKTMYFTRNNYINGKKRKSSDKVVGLKIYKATLNDEGKWTNVTSLPFNNDEYNVAHPALSLDNKKLYFASDMPGTKGKSDIFVVDILEDGSYGEPTNLGDVINTEGRENFPYVSNNGTLYFSSDGHQGLGGLDIFYANITSNIEQIQNLGKPVNSPRDDFEFIIDEFTNTGYLTSNRYNGKGDDDIYKFQREICNQLVAGTVVDKNTNIVIPNANVIIYNDSKEKVYRFTTDVNGAFSYNTDCKKGNFRAVASKEGYDSEEIIYTIDPEIRLDIALKLNLTPKTVIEEPATVGVDLFELLDLNPIYFNFDKSNIRPDAQIELEKVINYLKQYPSVSIDVQSHTDSRASNEYNQALSNRRNVSTKNWIIQRGGISASRITGRGYGESQLTNRCSDGVECSEEEHQQNRRSMFIVTKN
ncbi:outer membrane protein OmpA-like peptidoglycan-associated protein [Lacinutrix venerupis]|uniref:Flagellar motor protein MotB n=1 Tax=Lacinutrix venerupis TaxID=1486034 RepID=A0AAC9LQ35_9FLAO|nr:OmpA family protein [Lacinutrix venerupis]APY00887.1 flagellar motor protein MotB [Lacinutrix venerupis]RLJ64544.1 outer membrane protein OmpA-like peptidoglycan-associated protein [Lacinutrix venerupis]